MFITPEETISYFGIAEGMRIADLGCGTGSYTIPMALRIRGAGKVYAIEVQKELLERMTRDALTKHLTNIEPIWWTIEHHGGTKLADQSIDVALLSNVLFQVEDRIGCMKELMRIVKHDGHVVVIDWSESFNSMGPIADHVLNRPTAEALFTQYGFTLDRDFPAGSHHYGLIFKKK